MGAYFCGSSSGRKDEVGEGGGMEGGREGAVGEVVPGAAEGEEEEEGGGEVGAGSGTDV